MAKHLVIVESPAKAKTIKKYLGSTYQVVASEGHVRDLPQSKMGIDIEADFEPQYITIRGKGPLLAKLRQEVKKADKIYLATDPDREGEAISWHLIRALNLPEEITRRVTFNEITKDAVKAAVKAPRDIDEHLVDAQQARRVLDRIVGYQISPVLWKKVKRGLSAGRVQAAALRLLTDREEEINDFIEEEYWTIEADFLREASSKKGAASRGGEACHAKLTSYKGSKLEIGTEAQAAELFEALSKTPGYQVVEVKTGKRSRKAPDPFITSTLQQEASRKLNYTPSKTMSIAQQLYEGVDIAGIGTVGLISYLRTDSVRISEEMVRNAHAFIEKEYGKEYVGSGTKKASGRRVQDAHEAIRPTSLELLPSKIAASLTKEQLKLYELIFNRFLSSQMADAVFQTVHVGIGGGDFMLECGGSRMEFAGFLQLTKEKEEEAPSLLFDLKRGETLTLSSLDKLQHFTQPPARFTEGLLVRAMEENGVGRPSTYAPTIATLIARGYISKEKKLLYVTELGQIVSGIIASYFESIDNVGFTARMESRLDEVEEGTLPWKEVIRNFYESFEPQVEKAMEELDKIEIRDEVTDIICEKCGRNMVIKDGRYGKFYACPGFPECQNIKPYLDLIGVSCPKCGKDVLRKKSRKGRVYFGCSGYPDCDYMSWDQPTESVCPNCGERLYKKGGRKPRLVCHKEGCGYLKLIEEEDE